MFHRNRRSEGHTLPKGLLNELLPYFIHLLHDLVKNQYKKFAVFSICSFVKIGARQAALFLQACTSKQCNTLNIMNAFDVTAYTPYHHTATTKYIL